MKAIEAALKEMLVITFMTYLTIPSLSVNVRKIVMRIIGTAALITSMSVFSTRIRRNSLKISMVNFNTEAVPVFSILNALAAGISSLMKPDGIIVKTEKLALITSAVKSAITPGIWP